MKGEVEIKLGGVVLDVRYTIDEPCEEQDIVLDRVTVPGSDVDITEALYAAAVAAAVAGATSADVLTAELRYISRMQALVMAAAETQAARNAADALADQHAEKRALAEVL